MRKRILRIILTLCLCTTLLSTYAFAASNPYPRYNWYNSASSYQIACTWYAWQQVYDRLGIALPKWGNGGNWYDNAAGSGYSVGSTPKVGAIACWSTTNTPSYGHVAYVTGVNSDGSFNLTEGGSGWPGATWEGICNRTVRKGQWWPDKGFIYLVNAEVSVTFTAWDNSNYTYIRETDASIGQKIDVSNGTCAKTGMILYDNSRKELGRAENPSYTYHQVFFKVNEELGVSLSPGTTYQYRFWASVNGKTYYSDYKSFKTSGTASVAVTGVSISNSSLSLKTGQTETLTAAVSPGNATDKTVTWSSSDTKVATVSGGKVTAIAAGTATITAKAGSKTATCTVTVSDATVAVTGISLDSSNLSLTTGGSATLTAAVGPGDATDKTVTWSSSASNVVTVSDTGEVKAVGYGTAVVTAKAGGYTASCKVYVVCNGNQCERYPDVEAAEWYHSAVDYVTQAKIMQGHDTGDFAPYGQLTRAEMATILYNYQKNVVNSGNEPERGKTQITFSDVKSGEWYEKAIAWASSNNIILGDGEGDNNTFRPDAAVSREEMVTMLYRYMVDYLGRTDFPQATTGNPDWKAFQDCEAVADWAETAFAWAVKHGIIDGDDGRLNPQSTATRAQAAKIIMVAVND